jgi:hypothetical protein
MNDAFANLPETPETLPLGAGSPFGRPSWSGLLQFSLVGIPLKAYPCNSPAKQKPRENADFACFPEVCGGSR